VCVRTAYECRREVGVYEGSRDGKLGTEPGGSIGVNSGEEEAEEAGVVRGDD